MNNEGDKSIKIVISIIALLVLSVILIFVLLGRNVKSNPVLSTTTTHKAPTTKIAEEDYVKDNINNFNASLEQILLSQSFSYLNNDSIYYNGFEFVINCTSTYTDYCIDGKLFIVINDKEIELFDTKVDNYFQNSSELYFNYADGILYVSYGAFKKEMLIYNADGELIKKVTGVILGYQGNKYLYPTITDGNLYFYSCSGNNVHVSYVDLKNDYSIIDVEKIDESFCS